MDGEEGALPLLSVVNTMLAKKKEVRASASGDSIDQCLGCICYAYVYYASTLVHPYVAVRMYMRTCSHRPAIPAPTHTRD